MKSQRKVIFDIPALEMNAKFRANDYCVLSGENDIKIGMCEITGRRLAQEDVLEYSTDVAAQFVDLQETVVQKAIEATFEELQNKYGQDEFGTTACVTTAWIDAEDHLRIWNANVGDSAAWLVIINEETKVSSVIELNALHSPNPAVNKEEHDRVSSHAFQRGSSGVWAVGNPYSNISLTRAIGDNKLEGVGIIHVPEFTRHVQLADPQEKYFLITACDGLTESDVLTSEDIKAIVATHRRIPLHEIALKLVLAAYKEESDSVNSHDNISVAITAVTKTPVSLAIFDGHGGISKVGVGVSFDLGKHFYPTLAKKIATAAKDYDPTSQALEIAIRKKDWTMAVYILMTLENCKTLNAKILKKINSHRSQLTDAFIAQVEAQADAPIKNNLVRDVMNQKNALGIILHTPRYEMFFKFTQREHNNKKVTGSIFKICQQLRAEVLLMDIEMISPEHILGVN
jgi:serine/threonine protein phosphatase PrpC